MPKLSLFKITKRSVDALPTENDALFFDADLKGFAVRTKPSGSKTYLVQYKNTEGRTRRITLGKHGPITPSEARSQATILLGKVHAGEDPSQQQQAARKQMTVAQLCSAYLDSARSQLILGKRGQPKRLSTLSVDRGRIERHILPLLGRRKVAELTTPDITRFMRDVASGRTAVDVKTCARGRAIVRGGNGTASRTVGLLGGILSYAVSEGIIPMNPVRGVKRPADKRRTVRLSADEYALFFKSLRAARSSGVAWQAVSAAELLALTGCRRGEIEQLRWSEVDVHRSRLVLSGTKTGLSVRPVGAAALAVLSAIPRTSEYVFPGANASFYRGLPKAWNRILHSSHREVRLTPHALRHAFASTAHDLGFSDLTIGALLGHASSSITGRYVHHIDDALLTAANMVADFIASTSAD